MNSRRWACVAAVAVFILGFGALATFSLLGAGEPGLRGLYTYRSATIGDGLLLPTLAYSLVRAARLDQGWNRKERRIVIGAGVAGALGGTALQAQWLLDPHPRLNWTLPAPHTFNAPGWYHAAFLVLACGFFAGLGAAAWLRVTTLPVGALGVLVPALGFIALLAEDNTGSLFPTDVLASAFVLFLVLRSPRFRLVAAAAIAAWSLAALFSPAPVISAAEILPVIAAALVGGFVATTLTGPSIVRIGVALLPALCAAGPIQAASNGHHVTVAGLALGCAAAFVLATAEVLLLRTLVPGMADSNQTIVQMSLWVLPITAFGSTGRYFAQDQRAAATYSTLAGAVAAALILRLSTRATRRRFDLVIEAETADAPDDVLSPLKWRAYWATATLYSAAGLACLAYFTAVIPSTTWKAGSARDLRPLVLLSIGLVVAIVILAAVRLTPVAILVSVAWSAAMIAALFSGYGSWEQLGLSVTLASVVGLFIGEGVISNIAYLHNLPVDRTVTTVAVTAGLGGATTMAWMSGPAIDSGSGAAPVDSSLWALALGSIACAFLPFLAARTLPGATPPRQYTIATPLAGVLQDAFVVTLLAVSICWMPNFLLAHIPSVGVWLGTVLAYLALLSAAYVYVMKNNVGHVAREKKRVADRAAKADRAVSADEKRALHALARHIERQNRLAMVALIPLGMLLIFNEISGFDREGLRQLLRIPE